jgi:hypothetical protein
MLNPLKVCLIFVCVISFISCSRKIIPDKPSFGKTDFKMDSLPESEINVPIQVNLEPIYSMAEKTVDTVFTSPNWPNGWVQDECDTGISILSAGSIANEELPVPPFIGLYGYYRIIGSTRVCVNGTASSPWTPACRCGYDEGERRVNVSFRILFLFRLI